MPSIVDLAQRMIENIPEFEINLRPKRFMSCALYFTKFGGRYISFETLKGKKEKILSMKLFKRKFELNDFDKRANMYMKIKANQHTAKLIIPVW